MSFPKIKVTEQGRAVVARALAGEKMQFTHFAIGNGICGSEDDWPYLTAVIGHIRDVVIADYTHEANVVKLTGEFTNSDIEEEFWWREIGIYATITTDTGMGNVLCFYGNAGDLSEFVPTAVEDAVVTHRWNTHISISNDADVSALVSSVTYATVKQLEDHKENKSNPHNVTAAQVGLGNVPNVATDDQRPSFTEAKELEKLTSKEKLSTMLGKIANAVTTLIAHVKDTTGNPHKVTAKNAGAAPESHSSPGTAYGVGNSKNFGHVRLTDDTNVETSASDGIAVTPKLLRTAITEALKNFNGNGSTGSGTAVVDEAQIKKIVDAALVEAEASGIFDGDDGVDGRDGLSPIISLNEVDNGVNITVQDAQGIKSVTLRNGANGKDGLDGEDGENGIDGEDGVSPTVDVIETESGYNVLINDVNGPKTMTIKHGERGEEGPQGPQGPAGTNGENGADGRTPVKGTDYYTPDEEEAFREEVLARVPVTMAPDGYADFHSLRKAVDISCVKEDNIITISATLEGEKASISMIQLDDNGYPVQIITNGNACTISWEGFVSDSSL